MAANAGGIGSIDQVAVVVRDLDRAMERYTNDLGIGPWAVHTFSPDWIGGMTFRGKEQGYTMKLALAQLGPVMYELIEPLEGPTSYHEFLDEHGEGLHHLGYFVEDIDAEIKNMESKGFALLQSGRGFGKDVTGAYAYFDTERAVGCIVEAIELPAGGVGRPGADLPGTGLALASSRASARGVMLCASMAPSRGHQGRGPSGLRPFALLGMCGVHGTNVPYTGCFGA